MEIVGQGCLFSQVAQRSVFQNTEDASLILMEHILMKDRRKVLGTEFAYDPTISKYF